MHLQVVAAIVICVRSFRRGVGAQHTTSFKAQLPQCKQAYRTHIGEVLLYQHTLSQSCRRIVIQHGHRRLNNDWPRIVLTNDEVDRTA